MSTPAHARTRARITTVALGAIAALLVALPGSASAARPLAFHDHFTDSFSDVVCGIAVKVDVRVTDNFFLAVLRIGECRSGGAGVLGGPVPEQDERAGTISFLTSFKGLPEKIRTARWSRPR